MQEEYEVEGACLDTHHDLFDGDGWPPSFVLSSGRGPLNPNIPRINPIAAMNL